MEIIDTIDMVSGFNEFFRVIDAAMSELGNIQRIIVQNATHVDIVFWFNCHSK